MSPGNKSRLLIVIIALWLLSAAGGLAVLADYSYQSGSAARPQARWPGSAFFSLERDAATLVMLAHPHCPCTRASIGELAKLMARAQRRLRGHVLFLRPAGFTEGWERTDLWASAEAIPGIRVWSDPEGREARRFGGRTSGQVMVFDSAGSLIFDGGITIARGHAGDNPGAMGILARLDGRPAFARTPVFGCALESHAAR
ncbi:MAG: RedB protein [Bryobacteraceae bacterium]